MSSRWVRSATAFVVFAGLVWSAAIYLSWDPSTVWSALGATTTGIAAGVAVYLAWLEQGERTKRRDDEERAQASRVSIRLVYPETGGGSEGTDWYSNPVRIYVWNSSDLPITDVLLSAGIAGDVMPGTPARFSETYGVMWADEKIGYLRRFVVPRKADAPHYESGPVTAALEFTDAGRRRWRRDADQQLTLLSRAGQSTGK